MNREREGVVGGRVEAGERVEDVEGELDADVAPRGGEPGQEPDLARQAAEVVLGEVGGERAVPHH